MKKPIGKKERGNANDVDVCTGNVFLHAKLPTVEVFQLLRNWRQFVWELKEGRENCVNNKFHLRGFSSVEENIFIHFGGFLNVIT
jgi:hypothetical protein